MKLTKNDAETLGAVLGEHDDDSKRRALRLSQAIVSHGSYGRPPVRNQGGTSIGAQDSIPDVVMRGLRAVGADGSSFDAEDWPALVEELEDIVAYLIEMRRFP